MIKRFLEDQIINSLGRGKVIVVYGPRRIGKTTLVKSVVTRALAQTEQLFLNCDEQKVQSQLAPTSLQDLMSVVGNAKTIIIDEAQRVKNIGLTLKILIDAHPELNIIATGSASFDLANKIKEPLTGRVYEFILAPLTIPELQSHFNYNHLEIRNLYERLMRYGSYPSLIEMPEQLAEEELRTISSQYIYKDALELTELRQRQLLPKLMEALALQVGGEVSFNELGNLLDAKFDTVDRYLTLLEHAFIVYRVPALTGNKRTMLSNRKRKVYFYDLGVRNALVRNFNPLEIRQDVGGLWENLCFNERRQIHKAKQTYADMYYWRGVYGEVDIVENSADSWQAFECKWQANKFRLPKAFNQSFPGIPVSVLNNETLLQSLTKN